MGEQEGGFKIVLPELKVMFPKEGHTTADHYRANAFGWMLKAGLDPYQAKDRVAFRDAVLEAVPGTWQLSTALMNMIRAWNPALASIERTVSGDEKFSAFSGPPMPPLPPMTQRERDLTRVIISNAMQINGRGKKE